MALIVVFKCGVNSGKAGGKPASGIQHKGQSMVLPINTLVPDMSCPPLAGDVTNVTPLAVHSMDRLCGVAVGEAIATLKDSTNHAKTKREVWLTRLGRNMAKLSSTM